MWGDWRRETYRKVRKQLGFPASSDVQILADMLKALVQLLPGDPPTQLLSGRISYPSILALYHEDIVDAAEYVGVQLPKGMRGWQPRELTAAYAGYGMGLCPSFDNKKKCRSEELELPPRSAILIEYTKHALVLHTSNMREAEDLANQHFWGQASFTLGSENKHAVNHPEEVGKFVLEFLHKEFQLDPPAEGILAIMTGSPGNVGDVSVQDAIRHAFAQKGFKVSLRTSDPEYVAVRGAAELAWRAMHLSSEG
jgi:hypothetical protein